MASLTREQILSADDLRPAMEAVDVPEWGGKVYVRVMTGAERDAFESKFNGPNRYTDFRAFTAVCCVCDDQGVDLFKPEDVPILSRKSGVALDRILPVAMKVNKLRKEDVEELVGNSRASHSAASRSASRPL